MQPAFLQSEWAVFGKDTAVRNVFLHSKRFFAHHDQLHGGFLGIFVQIAGLKVSLWQYARQFIYLTDKFKALVAAGAQIIHRLMLLVKEMFLSYIFWTSR